FLTSGSTIRLRIMRQEKIAFQGETTVGQIKRSFDDLAHFLYREQVFPYGSYLMTGTGIVPPSTFTLEHGDFIRIEIDGIGVLENQVE
ncbi:MAG: fumarylacetoacetate hydrolase family protein, partial [Verrucomicrobiota bacterium]